MTASACDVSDSAACELSAGFRIVSPAGESILPSRLSSAANADCVCKLDAISFSMRF